MFSSSEEEVSNGKPDFISCTSDDEGDTEVYTQRKSKLPTEYRSKQQECKKDARGKDSGRKYDSTNLKPFFSVCVLARSVAM